jgi:predicted transcriptional regulator
MIRRPVGLTAPYREQGYEEKKEWVSLTDKEIDKIARNSQDGISPHDDTLRFARAIEAKLKEKNT